MSSFVGGNLPGSVRGSAPRFPMESSSNVALGTAGPALPVMGSASADFMSAFPKADFGTPYDPQQAWGVRQHDRQQPAYYNPNIQQERPANAANFSQLAGTGLGAAKLAAEYILSHPCVMLRHQAQVSDFIN